MTSPKIHGYSFGRASTGYEEVRRARKSYTCEGVMVNSDSLEDAEVSPGTGCMVFEGNSDSCSQKISIGDLYVALEFAGENAQDLGAVYRYTFRTCLNCALEVNAIMKQASH